jgi:hypothetical protein
LSDVKIEVFVATDEIITTWTVTVHGLLSSNGLMLEHLRGEDTEDLPATTAPVTVSASTFSQAPFPSSFIQVKTLALFLVIPPQIRTLIPNCRLLRWWEEKGRLAKSVVFFCLRSFHGTFDPHKFYVFLLGDDILI